MFMFISFNRFFPMKTTVNADGFSCKKGNLKLLYSFGNDICHRTMLYLSFREIFYPYYEIQFRVLNIQLLDSQRTKVDFHLCGIIHLNKYTLDETYVCYIRLSSKYENSSELSCNWLIQRQLHIRTCEKCQHYCIN